MPAMSATVTAVIVVTAAVTAVMMLSFLDDDFDGFFVVADAFPVVEAAADE